MAAKKKTNPVFQALGIRTSNLKLDHLNDAWIKASDRLYTDADGAITAARALVEATCKHILDEQKISYEPHADLPKLYSLISAQLGIGAKTQTDYTFRNIFSATHTMVQSLAELRNKLGDAHGKGKTAIKASKNQATLAVHLAASVSLFLLETYESYVSANKRLLSKQRALLRFDKTLVWRLVDHVRNSPKWFPSWGQKRGKPCLCLVGDSGVYLINNGNPPILANGKLLKKGGKISTTLLMAPAEGCDPTVDSFEDWWPIHNAIDGGNDFSRDIPIIYFERALETARTHIVIVASRRSVRIYSDVAYGE